MTQVLVTGACGFIGSHLSKFLTNQDLTVRGVDNRLVNECFLDIKSVTDEYLQLDLRTSQNCAKAVKGMDIVYNLAANMGGIGFITEVGADVMRDNTLINTNMLEASVQQGIDRIYFSSSACIYPTYMQEDSNVSELKESDAYPADPDNFYGWEKLYTEKMMEAYHRDYNLNIRIGRYHNIYGPNGTFEGGREKSPAAICRKVAEAKDGDSITIWGDGEQTRSYCFMEDCVEGTVKLLNSDYIQPLNIGSNRLVTINQLADIVISISGKSIKKEHDLTKPQGVRGRNADLTLVKQLLGWEPTITLEKGLEKTYTWIKAQIEKRQ